jgi:hypothetical protein
LAKDKKQEEKKPKAVPKGRGIQYSPILSEIWRRRFIGLEKPVEFTIRDITTIADELGIRVPENRADLSYSFRFRADLPAEIQAAAPAGKEWIIRLAGRGKYRLDLVTGSRIEPDRSKVQIKIPDATPEIISRYARTDEQALLAAKVRYNRLIDIFLGVTAYSLQNHLRTNAKNSAGETIGVEIDELYVGINKHGVSFVIPVQAKRGKDRLSFVQTEQDVAYCKADFPHLICRPIAAQFLRDGAIALFELAIVNDEIKKVEERHYRLVPADQITTEDLQNYRIWSDSGK